MKRVLVIFTLLALAMAGCGRKYKLKRDDLGSEARWAAPHQAPRNIGTIDQTSFNGRLHLLWKKRSSGKPAAPLCLANNSLVFPDTKKKIRFYDLSNGHERGRIKIKGSPTAGFVVDDSLGFYALGPRANFVGAVDLLRYKSLWKRRIKDVSPGPIITHNRLIVSSGDGRVEAYSLEEGELLWSFDLGGRLESSASFADGRLWQANDRGVLVALSIEDGSELTRVELNGPSVSPPVIADAVYAVVMTGKVFAIDPVSGTIRWQTDLKAPVWTTPVVAHGRLYLGQSDGGVVALNAADGQRVWRRDFETVVKAPAVALGRHLVVGTMSGSLMTLDAESGATVDSLKLDGAIEFSPVTDGQRLYVATQSGRIFCFGENHEQADRADQRVSP